SAALGRAAETVCTVRDDRLDELSGMVAVGSGYVVVNDGSDFAARRKIFFLNSACKVTRTVSYPSRPRDTEDLARGRDGTLWVGDIGDNSSSRTTIALWKLAPGARTPTLFRMTYPDGSRNAEALLVTPGNTPIVISKEGGTAGLYVPARPLSRDAPTPLRRAGEVTLPLTSTSNPFSFLGRAVITGAATSPDGTHVALRTYADAFEFPIPDGDVIRGLTSGKPRQIPLPDEPQGEAITYTPDGRALLTVSESSGEAAKDPVILRYALPDRPEAPSGQPTQAPPSTAAPEPSPSSAAIGPGPATAAADGSPRFNYITVVVGLILTLAALLAVAVVLLARRSRRR
ncbi:esterase-like activity of phytase family protein, partial [Paractinoplanes brasiliensis]